MAAVILSVVPGTWISLTRHFPGMPSIVADVIELSSHFFAYAVLVGAICAACKTWKSLILIYVAAVCIGLITELVQAVLPQRGASLTDVAMNVLGVSCGFLFGVARLKRNTRVSLDGQGR